MYSFRAAHNPTWTDRNIIQVSVWGVCKSLAETWHRSKDRLFLAGNSPSLQQHPDQLNEDFYPNLKCIYR